MELKRQKRALAIHDISCLGKCSLTVTLPIISAAGIETSVIPTAVLSTHTGGFEGYTYRDLTDDILPIMRHWESLGIQFDAVYTGYLGSFEQIEIVKDVIGRLKRSGALVIVDPVMADNGVLYKNFREDFPDGMRELCRLADVILPNMTEAALLLGTRYLPGPYSRAFVDDTLRKLSSIGPSRVVLTDVSLDADTLGAACFDAVSGDTDYAVHRRVPGLYHGTGDVFGSAVVASLLTGHSLQAACDIAVEFTAKSIERTRKAGTQARFGVNFEAGLGAFIKAIKA